MLRQVLKITVFVLSMRNSGDDDGNDLILKRVEHSTKENSIQETETGRERERKRKTTFS